MSDPFELAKAFAVTPQGVVTRAPAARRAVPGRPSRPALHPTRGLPGGMVDRRTLDALSGGSVDETVRRFGRATRRQSDEFAGVINPLSGRLESMSRGNEVSTVPFTPTRNRRRLQALLERSSNPRVQERAMGALSGRIGETGMSGPQRVMVHNHPAGESLSRSMPSGQDAMSFIGQQQGNLGPKQEWQVVSLRNQRRFAASPTGEVEQQGTVPRTAVNRLRSGPQQTPARLERASDRMVGLDAGASATGMPRYPKAHPLANRVAGVPVKERADVSTQRGMLREAIRGGTKAGLPETKARRMGRSLETARRRPFDDEAATILRAGGLRVDQRVMKGMNLPKVRRVRKPKPLTTAEAKAAGFDVLNVDRLKVDPLDVSKNPLDADMSWAKRAGIIKSGDPFEIHKRDDDLNAAYLRYNRMSRHSPETAREYAIGRIRGHLGEDYKLTPEESAAIRAERKRPRKLKNGSAKLPPKPVSLGHLGGVARRMLRKDYDPFEISKGNAERQMRRIVDSTPGPEAGFTDPAARYARNRTGARQSGQWAREFRAMGKEDAFRMEVDAGKKQRSGAWWDSPGWDPPADEAKGKKVRRLPKKGIAAGAVGATAVGAGAVYAAHKKRQRRNAVAKKNDPFDVLSKGKRDNITQTELDRRRAGRQKRQGRTAASAGGVAFGVGGGLMAEAASKEPRNASHSRAFLRGAARRAVRGDGAAARTLAGRAMLHSPSTVVGAGLAAGGAATVAGGLGWMGAGAARGRKAEHDLKVKRRRRAAA